MKRAVGVFFAAALTVAAARAFGSSAQTYIGLYTNAERTTWCTSCPAPCLLQIYAWVLPSYRGVRAVEFDISYPSNAVPTMRTVNCGSVDCAIICIAPCYAYAFNQCKHDWIWIYREDVLLMSSTASEAAVVPAPGLVQIDYASCEQGYPVYPMTALNVFYFNVCGPLAVEENTWGSIKALFR